MKRTICISLAVAATALTLVGAFVLQPPPALASAPVEVEAAPPIAADSGDLLCNLSTSDVSDIINHYDLDPPSMPAVADALATPFDCDAYGDLCSVLTNNQAHAYACGAWTDMKAHYAPGLVLSRARDRLFDWGQSCTPDPEDCQDICGSKEVLRCSGVLKGGACWAIAMCDFDIPVMIEFLEFLGPTF